MCKLFAIVEVEDRRNAELFAKKAIPAITKTDDDGLGIMRLGENGIHIQRWLEPPLVVRKNKSVVLEKYEKALKHQENEAGKVSKQLYAIAVHGRMATCLVSLANTHPFYKGGTALMHNGIISNHTQYEKTLSSCDSEALLSQYLKHDLVNRPDELTTALDGMQGYYAAIVFNDNGVIDIWRDDAASLYMAHVKHVGVVIATTADIIKQTAKKCKAHITGMDEVLPFTSIRWTNGITPVVRMFSSEKYFSLTPSRYAPDTDVTDGNKTPTKEEIDRMLDEKREEDKWWREQGDDYYRPDEWDVPPAHHLTHDQTPEEIADERRLRRLQGRKDAA